MATIGQYLSLITNAVYGEEVRSSIVNAIQQCYTDATDVVKVSETEPTSENTRIWIKPTTDECKVPTWEEHEELSDEVTDLKSAFDLRGLKFLSIPQQDAQSVYSGKAENFPMNTFSWVGPSWFEDLPMSTTVWVFTIGPNNNVTYAMQYAIEPFSAKMWSRQKAYENDAWIWRNWIEFPKADDMYSYRGILENNADLNNVTEFGIYGINSDNTYYNKPTWFTNGGLLFVFKYNDSDIYFQTVLSRSYISNRIHLSSGWGEWSSRTIDASELNNVKDYSLHFIVVTQSGAETDYGKLAANLPGNTFCWVSGSWFTDMPSGTFWLFTIANSPTANYAGQIAYVPGTGTMWTRQKIAGHDTYEDWVLAVNPTGSFYNNGVLATGTDLNTIVKNSVYGLNSNGNYSNKPSGFGAGYLFTVAYGNGTSFILQIAASLNGAEIYTRRKNSSNSWDNWKIGIHDKSAKYFAFGDSTTYGQIGGVSPAQQSKYNYPSCIGKVLGMTTYNKAVGGQGLIKDWDTIHTNYITNLDMTDAKLITVGWAYNDGAYYGSIPFGAYSDTTDSSFIGKYFTIMKEFQQKCPSAKVILITGFGQTDGQIGPPVVKPTFRTQFTGTYRFSDGNKTVKEMYDTLESMCHLHGWSCVNQSKGTVFNEWNAENLIGDQIHPTNEGYLIYGNFLAARVGSMYSNLSSLGF